MQRVIKRAAPLALLVASAAFLLSGPLIGATHDEEEFRNTLLTSVLHARALADGVLPYWTSALGFGMSRLGLLARSRNGAVIVIRRRADADYSRGGRAELSVMRALLERSSRWV